MTVLVIYAATSLALLALAVRATRRARRRADDKAAEWWQATELRGDTSPGTQTPEADSRPRTTERHPT